MDTPQRKQPEPKKSARKAAGIAMPLIDGAAPEAESILRPAAPAPATAQDGHILAWPDDPLGGTPINLPFPRLADPLLAIDIRSTPVPAGAYQVGTANFRYWTAAEALRRCADFWAARVPSLTWQMGARLPIRLDEGLDFNAYYDRRSLSFFHGASQGGTVYSGESPDILCHEMGHAILDALKPQLWNVASHEAAAFHESFGDMSAILSALQLTSNRRLILNETGVRINGNSRLSRMAEQLGAAIRVRSPAAVEQDCLRNAANRFLYTSPLQLKSNAPASELSAEPHSFSRVFTGAFLDALAGMLAAIAPQPTEQHLLQVTADMGDILIAGVRSAPVVSNFYAQVAAGMVSAAGAANPAYPRALKAAFIKRDILSLHSATSVESLGAAAVGMAGIAPPGEKSDDALASIAFDGSYFGLGTRPLVVETASQPRRIAASAAANEFGSLQAPSSEAAARGFVEELFKRGRIDCTDVVAEEHRIDPALGLKTHRLVERNGAVQLHRVLCDCGLTHD